MHTTIISFDTRGAGASTRVGSCFPSNRSRWAWFSRVTDQGLLGASDRVLGNLWSLFRARKGACDEHSEEMRRHVTTPAVARDMLVILDAQHEWYDRHAGGRPGVRSKSPVAEKPKLSFWGLSYGTLLGATFAAMHSDRVGKMILDGVTLFEEQYNLSWTNHLRDTERAMEYFYLRCVAAGPALCPLARSGENATALRSEVDAWLDSVREQPLVSATASADGLDGPAIVEWSDLKALIVRVLYTPRAWSGFAHSLYGLYRGNDSSLARMLEQQREYDCGQHEIADSILLDREVQHAIICSDGYSPTNLNRSVSDAEAHYKRLLRLSPTLAPYFSLIHISCWHWTAQPAWKFNGPWEAETANPILLVGNTMDPIAPLGSARKQAKRFTGSRVLVQDSAGHTSLNAPSPCTFGVIKEYLRSGELPEEGKVCPPPFDPFRSRYREDEDSGQIMSQDMSVLQSALGYLADTFQRMGPGFDHLSFSLSGTVG